MKIAVLDDYADVFRTTRAFLRVQGSHEVVVFHDTEKNPSSLAARLDGADAVLLTQQRSSFSRAVIEKLTTVRWIAQTGRNTNHIDLGACAEKGITVVTALPGASYATVELTWGLILASLRHIPEEVQNLKQGVWHSTVGTGLRGATLGVYALGRIGGAVAQVGKAFGMKVLAWGREKSLTAAREAGYDVAPSREAFFEGADVVTIHLPLNDSTRGIVTAADLGRMKKTALFVNTSRARLVETGALVRALEQGRPGFAAVDVYEDEPVLGRNHPLLMMRNALCTPHLGYAEKTTYETYYGATIEALLDAVAGAR
ncbi:D-2-hydroxyacid dehydrogenase family protein [Pendulispora albinea]|uniref:D-2-hydroxyacid dehydrogenase family protein n=1 Tax=Pendulispora albinea TaxID=2741071 RepID=A0ABZ2LT80_9BACT